MDKATYQPIDPLDHLSARDTMAVLAEAIKGIDSIDNIEKMMNKNQRMDPAILIYSSKIALDVIIKIRDRLRSDQQRNIRDWQAEQGIAPATALDVATRNPYNQNKEK